MPVLLHNKHELLYSLKSLLKAGNPITHKNPIKNILLVEDDRALSMGIKLALQSESIQIEQCYTLADAEQLFLGQQPTTGHQPTVGQQTPGKSLIRQFDLIILDINLPDGSGLDFLCTLKRQHLVPVILLTANDLEIDIVTGLEMGAEDYITKPFSLAVLRARVNTQLRKVVSESSGYEFRGFAFDFERMTFHKDLVPVELSKTEQKLLKILIDNKGITLSRSKLTERIWPDGADYVDGNALSVTVKRLRDKLEDQPSQPQYIKTVYGIGYVWTEKSS